MLAAITILLVGVLGVVAMVDGANAVTSKTKAREGANNVARSVVEVGRAVPYKGLTDTVSYRGARNSAGPERRDGRTVAYTIASRGFNYDVPAGLLNGRLRDNLGPHDGTIDFCPDSDVGAGGANADRNPDDYKRIAVTLSWTRQEARRRLQGFPSLLNPVGGLGPTVIRHLDAPAISGTLKTVTSPGTVTFEADTSTDAAELDWSVDGAEPGEGRPDRLEPGGSHVRLGHRGRWGGRYSDCA